MLYLYVMMKVNFYVADSGAYIGIISENVKSVLQDFEKKHILVGFDVMCYVS